VIATKQESPTDVKGRSIAGERESGVGNAEQEADDALGGEEADSRVAFRVDVSFMFSIA
jgi:hypothetical protein